MIQLTELVIALAVEQTRVNEPGTYHRQFIAWKAFELYGSGRSFVHEETIWLAALDSLAKNGYARRLPSHQYELTHEGKTMVEVELKRLRNIQFKAF